MTQRELDIALLIADGLSDKQIAQRLGISHLTARKHRANLQNKVGVSNSCALVFELIAAGCLPHASPEPVSYADASTQRASRTVM